MIRACQIANYRSVRKLELPLDRVTVLIGANGSGKTNCYRALQLAHAAASGRLADHFLEEGGMASALWAGAKSTAERGNVRLSVEVQLDQFTYRIACGLPTPKAFGQPKDMHSRCEPILSFFSNDAEVKEEDVAVQLKEARRLVPLCERRNLICTLRDENGARVLYSDPLDLTESVLAQIADPRRYGELALVRETLSRWRFYHQFRTDSQAAMRHPRLGVRSPILSSNGDNLAAALQTIIEMDGDERLRAVLARALPGLDLIIERDEQARMVVAMRKAGLHRDLAATELSDGVLRFLCLSAALLSPRPPEFLALNEPETSLHGDLIPALADLIIGAGERAQVLVTTHSQALAEIIAARTESPALRLRINQRGETELESERGLLKPKRSKAAD